MDVMRLLGEPRISDLSPVVIGGCARSGTTLLLSVLSCHPRIYAIPVETQALCPTAYDPKPKSDASLDIASIEGHLNRARITRNCRYWCEKTPRNVMFFSRILKHFGSALRILHVVRDGRDVVCSVHPSAPDRPWVEPTRWVTEVEAGLVLDGHPQVLIIRYEDLVLCYEKTVSSILSFLSLEYVPEMNQYPRHAKVVSDNAWFGPARPVSVDSIGRWRDPRHRKCVESLLNDSGACRLLSHLKYDMAGK